MAVNLTVNPLFLALIMLAVIAVIMTRRSDAPWARSIAAYFWLAGIVITIRMVFQIVVGGGQGEIVLFTLPQIALPEWAAGIRLGGDVTAEGVLYTFYDSLRLVVMLLCVAAANALANPRRALRSVPAALHDISVAVVIALSVAPQLVESAGRVRRARRLRGGNAGFLHTLKAFVVPIVADAVDRSISLATSMEARGFGRSRVPRTRRIATNVLLLASAMVLTFGGFIVLSQPQHALLGLGTIAVGALGVVLGLRHWGAGVRVTRYRPDPWRIQETLVAACGLGALLLVLALGMVTDSTLLYPPTYPPEWPQLHPLLLVAAILAVAPIAFTNATPRARAKSDTDASADAHAALDTPVSPDVPAALDPDDAGAAVGTPPAEVPVGVAAAATTGPGPNGSVRATAPSHPVAAATSDLTKEA